MCRICLLLSSPRGCGVGRLNSTARGIPGPTLESYNCNEGEDFTRKNKLKQLRSIIIFPLVFSTPFPKQGRSLAGGTKGAWFPMDRWVSPGWILKGFAPSEPLPQLGTPSLPLPRGFAGVEEGLKAHACLSFTGMSPGSCLLSQNRRSWCLWAY